MKAFFALIAAAVLALSAGNAGAQTLNWGSAAFSDLYDSEGNVLDSSFVFELGAFDPSFVPDETNVDLWFANWRVFDTAAYNAGNGVFTGTESLKDYTSQQALDYASLFEGLDAYIWVRNQNTPGVDTEWFMARKSSWVFPTIDANCCANGEVTQWSIASLGADVPVWGNQNGIPGGGEFPDNGTYDIQTHAVPEPTAPLLALLGAASLLRRRRNF